MKRSAFAAAPAAITGGLILLEALAARALLRADEARVFLMGRPLDWQCAMRARFGLPCPTCGLTRSVVLSLHGELVRGWNVAPAGPVLTLGAIAFALALVLLGFMQGGELRSAPRVGLRLRHAGLIYAAGACAIWMGGWIVSLAAALSA